MDGGYQAGTVGILPAGALGVAFYHHLTREPENRDRVFFMERAGSQSGASFRGGGELRIRSAGELRTVSLQGIWLPSLMETAARARMPEVILVCTQPDQLLGVIQSLVDLLVSEADRRNLEEAIPGLPNLVLCSNGIYFQRVRQFLVEKLEEATLFGRLPDLWPDAMPRVVAKLLRGVTIQTGQREGSGPAAVYAPGPSGRTRVAGGGKAERERCAALLTELGGWFEVAGDASPTRVEFEKALVNLTVNLIGQLAAIDDDGRFSLLPISEILSKAGRVQARELAEQVVAVGRAVHAFGRNEPFEPLFEQTIRSCEEHLEHVPSSLQWVDLKLRSGTLEAKLSPTEAWLIEPLVRYANAAGLEDAVAYFEGLTQRVESRLALAAARAATRQ